MFYKEVVLKNLAKQESTYARASFSIKLQASAFNFIKNEAQAQVFFCEFCVIFKSNFLIEYLQATASVTPKYNTKLRVTSF